MSIKSDFIYDKKFMSRINTLADIKIYNPKNALPIKNISDGTDIEHQIIIRRVDSQSYEAHLCSEKFGYYRTPENTSCELELELNKEPLITELVRFRSKTAHIGINEFFIMRNYRNIEVCSKCFEKCIAMYQNNITGIATSFIDYSDYLLSIGESKKAKTYNEMMKILLNFKFILQTKGIEGQDWKMLIESAYASTKKNVTYGISSRDKQCIENFLVQSSNKKEDLRHTIDKKLICSDFSSEFAKGIWGSIFRYYRVFFCAMREILGRNNNNNKLELLKDILLENRFISGIDYSQGILEMESRKLIDENNNEDRAS